jgi:hypothetical protein
MEEGRHPRTTQAALQSLTRRRQVLYWCGRSLQVFGLLLIWWILLLFAGAASMGMLLWWGMVATAVFYAGWACTMWARKGC